MEAKTWKSLKDWYFAERPIEARHTKDLPRSLAQWIDYRFAGQNHKHQLLRYASECAWEADGFPYYNVHNHIIPSLSRCNISKIPCRFLEVPNHYDACLLRFKKPHADLGNCKSLLFAKTNNTFVLTIDFGQQQKGQRMHDLLFLDWTDEPNCCLPDGIQRILTKTPEHATLEHVNAFTKIITLIACVGFLANSGDDLLERDILNRDKDKFFKCKTQGDQAGIETIYDRASRNGKNKGWNVGTDELLLGSLYREQIRDSFSHETVKQLTYTHLRCGHPHCYLYGKGKQQVKVKWLRSIRVRPDLPWRPLNA